MGWISNYQQDISRYTAYSRGSAVRQVLTQQGLWALLQYRVARSIYEAESFAVPQRPILVIMSFWQKLIEVLTGISLPYTAQIGPGLYIGHFGNIIVNGFAVIGPHCNLSQGVTVGVSGRGSQRGVPTIGAYVYIGANAVVAGKIVIGNHAVVAANSLVTRDVPDHCTVLGVPAIVVGRKGSDDFIQPEVEP